MIEPVSTTSLIVPYAISSLTTSLNSFVSGHFNREESRIARWENFAFQKGLENERQQLQLAQMKLSVLQQKDNQDFQRELAQQNREFQKEIEEFRQSVNIAIHQSNLNFQKWRFEQEKELQLEILNLNQVFQREINQVQHQNTLNQIEKRYEIERENPLFLLASRLLKSSFSHGIMPLKILLSPPELDYDVNKPQGSKLRIESFLAEEIRQFIRQGYGINDRERPTELLDKAWSSKKFAGGSAIRYLYDELKSMPVLILESEFVNEDVNLRLNYWDGEIVDPKHNIFSHQEEVSILSSFSYRDFLLNSAKSRAIEWRKTKAELLENGLNEAKVKTLAVGNNEENLAILEDEESTIALIKATNQDISKLNIGKNYKISNEDWEAFYNYLAVLHCLAIGTITDILALQRSYNLQPLLPKLLPSLLSKLNSDAQTKHETIKPIVKVYRNFYQGIEKQTEFSSLVPNLTIDFALSLADLSDKTFAVEEAKYSVAVWLKLHGIEPDKIFDLNSDEDCQLLKSIIYQEDEVYLTKLQQLVEKVGDTADNLVQIKSLLAGWQNLKRWGNGIHSLSDLEEFKEEVKKTEKYESGLSIFNFETKIVNHETKRYGSDWKDVYTFTTKIKQAKYFTENLSQHCGLDMVFIPGGNFALLEKYNNLQEKYYNASIQYEIQEQKINNNEHIKIEIKPFFMGKYPVTQQQWNFVANLPVINDYLFPCPDAYGRSNLPVRYVSWYDAVEFCARLSKLTSKNYFLPSETQWEYACRSGSNARLNIINDNLFSLDKIYNISEYMQNKLEYGGGLRVDIISLIKVLKPILSIKSGGNSPPNDFGLYDIYGNIWEWCADIWHENYVNVPKDGTPWWGEENSYQKIVDKCRQSTTVFIEKRHQSYSSDVIYRPIENYESYAIPVNIGENFVVRGGSYNTKRNQWGSDLRSFRTAYRNKNYNICSHGVNNLEDVGFRVACTL